MTILFMSDGRQFTDYTSPAWRASQNMKEFSATDPKTLRYVMQQNAESIINTNATDNRKCPNAQTKGMTVMCGLPIADYFVKRN